MKTAQTLAIAAALTLAPTLTFAMGCSNGAHTKQAQSCISGSAWDENTQTCVPSTSS